MTVVAGESHAWVQVTKAQFMLLWLCLQSSSPSVSLVWQEITRTRICHAAVLQARESKQVEDSQESEKKFDWCST